MNISLRINWTISKNLSNINNSTASSIHLLTDNNDTITDPIHIANIFKNYFRAIAQKTQAKIKFPKKSFMEYFYHPNKYNENTY